VNTMINPSTRIASHKFRFVIYFTVFVVFQLLLIRNNLFNDYFWLDESGQIWMALGQNHFSSPNSQIQGLRSVLENNAKYNLDPGGYTFLLRFWIELFGVAAPALRVFPYICYLATIGLLLIAILQFMRGCLAKESAIVALLGITCTPMFTYYAFEVRGYSLSLLLATFCFFALRLYIVNRRNFHYILLTFGLTLAITVRYTSLTYVFSILAILIVLDYRKRQYKRVFFSIFMFTVTCLTVLFTQFVYQFRPSKDSYLNSHMISGEGNLIPILRDNFLGFPGFIRLFVIVFSIHTLVNSRHKFNTSDLGWDSRLVFSVLSLSITFLQLLLSFLGLLPWHSSTRWSIEDLSFLLVLIIQISIPSERVNAWFQIKSFKVLVFLIPFSFTFSVLSFHMHSDFSSMKRSSDLQIAKLVVVPSFEREIRASFLIEKNLYPAIRYSLELDNDYGSHKKDWIDSKVVLFSNSEELRSILRATPELPRTIISSDEMWVYRELLGAGNVCSIVTRLKEIDPLAPSWVSIRLC
jgi:hypothetical protein